MHAAGKFFDQFADQFDTIYEGKRSRLMQLVDRRFRRDMFERFAITFELLRNISGSRVLDIGCGSGPYLAEALKRGALHVTGIDPARRMLELTARRLEKIHALERAQLVEGYFPGPTLNAQYDFAIVMGVMDYVADPVAFLKALRRLVTRGAVLSFPSTHWFRTPFRRLRYHFRNCPVYFYTEQHLQQVLTDAGISGAKIQKIPGAGMDFVVWIPI